MIMLTLLAEGGTDLIKDLILSLMFLSGLIILIVLCIVVRRRKKKGAFRTLKSIPNFDWETYWRDSRKFGASESENIYSALTPGIRLDFLADKHRSRAKKERKQIMRRRLTAYRMGIQTYSAEWERVAERVKAKFPNAKTDQWNTLDGLFHSLVMFCPFCGGTLQWGAFSRQVHGSVYGSYQYRETVDTGIRVGYTPVRQEVVRTMTGWHGGTADSFETGLLNCRQCRQPVYRQERNNRTYVITGTPCNPDSDNLPRKEIEREPERRYDTELFASCQSFLSEGLYRFLSQPPYLPGEEKALKE